MTLPVIVGTAVINTQGQVPYLIKPCSINTPLPEAVPETGDTIFTPTPPGFTFESLPVFNPAVQIIDTSPDQIIGCANSLPPGVEQSILDLLFPAAVSGDGIVNRENNDVWKYDGSIWENVGPNPGPLVIETSVLPPWNEILSYKAKVKTKLEIVSFDYAINLLAEPEPYKIVTKLEVFRIVPAASVSLQALEPVYIGVEKTIVQCGFVETTFSFNLPSILITSLPDPVIFSMDGADGATSVSSIDSNNVAASFFGNAQLDTSVKKWGDSSLQFPSSGDFVEFTAPDPIGTSNFTVEFWVYIPATSADFGTLAMISDLFSIDYDSSSGELYYYVAEGAGDGITHQNTITKEVWHHIALYRINGTVYLALDGVVSTTSAPEPHDFTGTLHRLNDWEGDGSFSTQSYIDDYRLTLLVAVYGTSDFTVPSGPFTVGDEDKEFEVPLTIFELTANQVAYIGKLATIVQPPSIDYGLTGFAPVILTSVVLEAPLTVLTLMGEAPSVSTDIPPELVASSSVFASTSSLTIDISGIYDTDDILLLVAETSGDASDATPDSGLFPDWNIMPNTPAVDVSSSSGSKLQAWWYRATSPTAYSSVDFPDTGDHQIARVFVIRGCAATGNPWDVTSSFFASDPSPIAAGGALNTTVAQTFVFSIVSHPVDTTSTSQFGAPSNTVLQNLTDVGEVSTDQGNGGGFVVATGVNKLSGDTGFIVYFSAPNATYVSYNIAFRP